MFVQIKKLQIEDFPSYYLDLTSLTAWSKMA